MGCHQFDPAVWALHLGGPTSVEAVQEGCTEESGPKWSVITYEFPARGPGLPPVTLKWYDGGKKPPRPPELPSGEELPSSGIVFAGETGKIVANHPPRARLLPEGKTPGCDAPSSPVRRSPGHRKEWLDAIRGGPPASSNFADYGGLLTEIVLLGNLAIRVGQRIEWDHANLRATSCPEADRYLRREYRKGWDFWEGA
jgi:hypothetical protein